MKIQESGEMYLESLLVLSKQQESVHAVDLAHHLGYSKPSVSRALGILANNGYIDISKNGAITFTDTGRQYAEQIFERHNVLTSFFESLGVDKQVAENDACKIEHIISEQLYLTIKDIVNNNK